MFCEGSVWLPGFNFADGFHLVKFSAVNIPRARACQDGKLRSRQTLDTRRGAGGERRVWPVGFGMRKAPGVGPLRSESAGSRAVPRSFGCHPPGPGETDPRVACGMPRGASGGVTRSPLADGAAASRAFPARREGRRHAGSGKKKGQAAGWRSCPAGWLDYLDLQSRTEWALRR